jgi:hypothetical protein
VEQTNVKDSVDLALKALGLVATAAFSLYQARNLLPGNRSRLQTDLEILKLLDADHPIYSQAKARVDSELERAFGEEAKGRFAPPRVYDWSRLVSGTVFATGFTAWTIYIVRHGFSWWAILTGLMALGGLGQIIGALEKPVYRASTKEKSPSAPAT